MRGTPDGELDTLCRNQFRMPDDFHIVRKAHSGAMQDSRTHATGFIVCVYIHEESSASELQETLSKVLLFHSFTFRDLLGDSYDRHNALLIQSRKTTHRRCGHWIWRPALLGNCVHSLIVLGCGHA